MEFPSVGFIGAGRIVQILVGGWVHQQQVPAVVAYDPAPSATDRLLAVDGRVEIVQSASAAAQQDILFLAVHPPAMKDALAALHGNVPATTVVVSLAPKFTMAKLSELLGGCQRLARVIPNAPSLVAEGYNPVAYGDGLNAGDKARLAALFSGLGAFPEVKEDHLEAYAILCAMGPTYFWPQLYALEAFGVSLGLSQEATHAAMDGMLSGTLATMKKAGLDAGQLHDLVPVKPMAEEIETLVSAYRTKLTALMEKIRP